MGGITLENFTHSRAYQEIFGVGEARGRRSEATTAHVQALSLEQLETLAEDLLDFTGPQGMTAWLAAHS